MHHKVIEYQHNEENSTVAIGLGVLAMTQRHTSKNLKDEITKIAGNYGIELDSVYSLTSGTAANTIKNFAACQGFTKT